MNDTTRKLISLAGFTLNDALKFYRHQPNKAKNFVARIEEEIADEIANRTREEREIISALLN